MSQVVEIIVKVQDGATQPLASVEKQLGRTGKAAKDAGADMWQFNKTMFSTIAFAGLFTRAFGNLKSAIEIGAPLDRITTQFERVMGPRGEFLQAFKATTNSIVDEYSLMESGVHLGQLGVTKSTKDTADVLAKMAVAARMAGKDASEGVKDLTTAIVDGNVAKLEEYGIMRKSNPMYMAMLATINKAGGIYGATLVKQQQIALVTKLLTEHTKQNMFMFMSTGEVVDAVGKKFKDTKQHIGTFLATALRPLLEKLIPFLDKLSDTLFYLYRNDKQIMFLTRSVLALTGALTGLFAVLGTVKLAVKLLGFAGVGFPGLITAVLGLGLAFHGLTKDADGVVEKFRVIGAIFKGVYELVTNLDPETGMSKISKSTRDLLEKYGLLGFTKTIARIISIIKTVLTDIYNVFAKVVSVVNTVFGGMFDKLKDIISSFTSDWTTWWTSDAISPLQKFVRAATAILAPLMAFFAFKGLKWGLGKIAGGFFGGGGNDGSSPTKALWVQNVGDMLSGLGAKGKTGLLSILTGPIQRLTLWFNNLILKSKILGEILTHPGGKLKGLLAVLSQAKTIIPLAIKGMIVNLAIILKSSLAQLVTMLGVAGTAAVSTIAVAVAAAAGIAIGQAINYLLDTYTQGETKEGFKGNILEQGIFKLFGDKEKFSQIKKFETDPEEALRKQYEHAQKMGWDKGLTFEQYKSKMGAKQTGISVPPESLMLSDTDIQRQLTEQMTKLSAEKQAELQFALSSALKTKEASERFISPEEYSSLLTLFKEALDTSDNMKVMASKARQPSYMNKQSNRPN